ncbi:hypothetical protein ACLSY0_09355 [Avibacterium avium]|uniref:hypothetical protein n=1 Tax=Avibacterium avium TaxID=751 RepID=UPI003BF873F2
MSNPNDLKSLQSYWSQVENYLLNLTSENLDSEHGIKKNAEVLSLYFSPFILELLPNNERDKLIDYLLEIRNYFINKKNYTLSSEHCSEVENLVNKLKDHFNKIGGNIPNLAILEKYENAINKQQKDIKTRANELFGELTTHSIKKPFNDQVKNLSCVNNIYTILFYSLLILLFFILKDSADSINFTFKTGDKTITLTDFISRTLVVMPVAWAILFTSKRISENKKLEQAYLHKEVIAQSYLNYLEFIKENYSYFSREDNNSYLDIINTLHKVSMEGLGLNPALLLDKSTSEKIPMEELLSRILDKTALDKKS